MLSGACVDLNKKKKEAPSELQIIRNNHQTPPCLLEFDHQLINKPASCATCTPCRHFSTALPVCNMWHAGHGQHGGQAVVTRLHPLRFSSTNGIIFGSAFKLKIDPISTAIMYHVLTERWEELGIRHIYTQICFLQGSTACFQTRTLKTSSVFVSALSRLLRCSLSREVPQNCEWQWKVVFPLQPECVFLCIYVKTCP